MVRYSVHLADALTKLEAERGYLTEAMKAGEVSVEVSETAQKTKEMIRASRHRRADTKRAEKETAKTHGGTAADGGTATVSSNP